MSLTLQRAPEGYNANDENQARAKIESEDKRNQKIGQNVDIRNAKLILTSPNGSRFSVTVDNSGTLSTTAL